jgi:hypothetical protein
MDPCGSETQISGSPVREEEKASCWPLGDQAGERLVPPTLLKRTRRPRSSEYMRIWKPFLPSDEKATRELSGETRGEMESSPR